MIVKLPRQTAEEIQRLLDTGEFVDNSNVLVEGVRMASKRRVKLEHFRGLIQEGPDEAERGEAVEVTREFRKNLRESARRLAQAGEPLDPD
jgi:Arc/MetJ-type ribon-helix-helix transcriptional regulator